jgi:hypothetical protein
MTLKIVLLVKLLVKRINFRENRRDNPEKLTTLGTQDTRLRHTKQKHNNIYVRHHYAQANANILNKT